MITPKVELSKATVDAMVNALAAETPEHRLKHIILIAREAFMDGTKWSAEVIRANVKGT